MRRLPSTQDEQLVNEEEDLGQGDENDQLRIFLANSNSWTYFNEPPIITDKESVDSIFSTISEDDLLENCSLLRDNSQWTFESFLSVCIYVVHLPDFPIGAGDNELTNADLPSYIVKNRNIETLLYNKGHSQAKRYTNLCIFRALAVHDTQNFTSYERLAKKYYKDYQSYLKINNHKKRTTLAKNFAGVTLKDVSRIEKCFEIDVQIWRLLPILKNKKRKKPRSRRELIDNEASDDGDSESDPEQQTEETTEERAYFNESFENMKARVIRHSLNVYNKKKTLHLLQYRSHFMYVKDYKALARR